MSLHVVENDAAETARHFTQHYIRPSDPPTVGADLYPSVMNKALWVAAIAQTNVKTFTAVI
jgi:hypothetical protein